MNFYLPLLMGYKYVVIKGIVSDIFVSPHVSFFSGLLPKLLTKDNRKGLSYYFTSLIANRVKTTLPLTVKEGNISFLYSFFQYDVTKKKTFPGNFKKKKKKNY